MSKWLTSKQFREKYGVSSATLWRRKHVGTVQTKEMYGNIFYLDEEENNNVNIDNRYNVIYCRVSNTK